MPRTLKHFNKSMPSFSGVYLPTSSTTALKSSPTLRQLFGAFVAYLVTYSTTAHKFKHGLQSTLPMFARSTCSS